MSSGQSGGNPLTDYCPYHRPPQENGTTVVVPGGRTGNHRKRNKCKECGRRFTVNTNTAMAHLKTPPEKVARIVKSVAKGLGIRPAADLFTVKSETVLRWLFRAGVQSEHVMTYFFKDISPEMVQLDELWTFIASNQPGKKLVGAQGRARDAWVWIAFAVKYRLVIAVHVGKRRQADADAFVKKIFERIKINGVLWTSDQLEQYKNALLARYQEENIDPVAEPGSVHYGRVIKVRESRKIVKVETEVLWGDSEEIQEILAAVGQNSINTAGVERVNLTYRQENSKLHRRSLTTARTWRGLQVHVAFTTAYYAFCRYHEGLREPLPPEERLNSKKWRYRTPAMAAGFTDHRWTVEELLLFQTPYIHDPFPVLPLQEQQSPENAPSGPAAMSTDGYGLNQSLLPDDVTISRNQQARAPSGQPKTLTSATATATFQFFQTLLNQSPVPRVLILYKDGKGILTERLILPRCLVELNNHGYLAAYCYLRDGERTFRVDRTIEFKVIPHPDKSDSGANDGPPMDDQEANGSDKPTSDSPATSGAAVRPEIADKSPVKSPPCPPTGPSPTSARSRRSRRHRGKKPPKPRPGRQSHQPPASSPESRFTGGHPELFLQRLQDKVALLIWQFLFWCYSEPQYRAFICEGTGLAWTTAFDSLHRLERYGLVGTLLQPKKPGERGRRKVLYYLNDDTLEVLYDPP